MNMEWTNEYQVVFEVAFGLILAFKYRNGKIRLKGKKESAKWIYAQRCMKKGCRVYLLALAYHNGELKRSRIMEVYQERKEGYTMVELLPL